MATDAVSITTPTSLDGANSIRRELHVQPTRRGFWLRWLPTFIGFIAGGALAVAARGFTSGGRVYVALYDVWGTTRYETRWTAASATVYGRDGSQDPAAGYVAGGTLSARFDQLCGATLMARAYDEATERWSTWLDVDTSAFGLAYYGPNGSADPARGYVAGC